MSHNLPHDDVNSFNELSKRARKGDRIAQDILIRHMYDRIYRHIRALCWNEELAMDLTQDVFFKGIKTKSALSNENAWSLPWFLLIGSNTFKSWINNVLTKPEPSQLDLTIDVVGREATPEEIVSRRELVDKIYKDLEKGGNHILAKLLHLHFEKGLTYDEMAKVLGISSGALRKQKSNYFRNLKFRKNDNDDGDDSMSSIPL